MQRALGCCVSVYKCQLLFTSPYFKGRVYEFLAVLLNMQTTILLASITENAIEVSEKAMQIACISDLQRFAGY